MDINSKVSKFKVLSSALVLAALIPSVSFAAIGANVGASGSMAATTNFCTELSGYSSGLNSRLSKAEGDLSGAQQTILTSAQKRQATKAQALAAARAKDAQTRQAIYVKLNAKATTDAEKQAVATFQSTIEADVTTREAAVDAATSAYWTAVMSLLTTRQGAVHTTEQDYSSAMSAAVSAAQSSCAAGTSPATVRATFASAVSAAHTRFSSDRTAVDGAAKQIVALAKTRDAAISAAFSTYNTQAKAAGATLKAAFAVSTTATTTPQ